MKYNKYNMIMMIIISKEININNIINIEEEEQNSKLLNLPDYLIENYIFPYLSWKELFFTVRGSHSYLHEIVKSTWCNIIKEEMCNQLKNLTFLYEKDALTKAYEFKFQYLINYRNLLLVYNLNADILSILQVCLDFIDNNNIFKLLATFFGILGQEQCLNLLCDENMENETKKNKIKAKKTKKLIDEFLEMRLDISKRIEELEDYFDENFGNIRMNILEKGIFQLKKLLFYNPDKNNDQEEADLPEFTGIVMDFNLIEKNNFANQEFVKNMRQSNIKYAQDSKMRATMRATMRASKYPQNLRKTKAPNMRETNVNNFNRSRITMAREKEETIETENLDENNIEDNIVKKKLRIRLTDEEYRLLQKLKAKKKSGNK